MADSPKKDFLEFPLEEVSIPQAVALSMLAATKTVTVKDSEDISEEFDYETDNDRLQLLCEKLEARVEDALEEAKAVRTETTAEDDPNDAQYSDVEGHKVTLVHEYVEFAHDNVITKVLVDNVVFVLACNERVFTDTEGITSTCIKRFGHKSLEHEDEEGNIR